MRSRTKQKVGIVGIIVGNRRKNASVVNKILLEHSEIIIGRMGIPQKDTDTGLISLFVEGDTDKIGSLTGKLGMIKEVTVKSILIPVKED